MKSSIRRQELKTNSNEKSAYERAPHTQNIQFGRKEFDLTQAAPCWK
jgi:hypothetical protein